MKIVYLAGPIFLSVLMTFTPCVAHAFPGAYEYNNGSSVLGAISHYRTKENESLIELARKVDIGYRAIADANPSLDPFVPGTGALVTIPSAWILPDVKSYDGIVINISELRLFYFTRNGRSQSVRIFPIGTGSEGHDTPPGIYKVVQKIVKPAWYVPASIRKEEPDLPKVVPAGPNNPLGSHALRLSSAGILIHGTNKPWGVGRRVSHGCIRLYPEDISRFFPMVPNGTKVTIVRQPVKVGQRNGKVYLEVHNDQFSKDQDYIAMAQTLLEKKGLLKKISTKKLYAAIKEKRGMPVVISENHEKARSLRSMP
jgi:L,D-transpeptidase ErfK/SrfK